MRILALVVYRSLQATLHPDNSYDWDNMRRLEDRYSLIDVGFVQSVQKGVLDYGLFGDEGLGELCLGRSDTDWLLHLPFFLFFLVYAVGPYSEYARIGIQIIMVV